MLDRQNKTIRSLMSDLHTWAGLTLGLLLFVIFWMGTLSVFDREIDRWMMPETRFTNSAQIGFDQYLIPYIDSLDSDLGIKQWGVSLPNQRTAYARLFYQSLDGSFHNQRLDMVKGEALPGADTLGATGFIFPFHYKLHLNWRQAGIWLVGLAAMAMLVLLVSGIVIHRKLLVEIFTFRAQKKLSRASLDLHNLSSVAFLPFHFLITLSGLIIFIGIYYPSIGKLVYADTKSPSAAFFRQAGDGFQRPALGQITKNHASLDAMVKTAEQDWQDKVGFIRVFHYKDKNSVVQLGRQVQGEMSWNIDKVFFDTATGERLHSSKIKPIMQAQRFFVGLHFIQFDGYLLRSLYFIGGLAACIMIATGFVFWLKARQKRHHKLGLQRGRFIAALTLGGCFGVVLASVAWMAACFVLPSKANWYSWQKAELEVVVFALVWLASCVWAWLFPATALARQCYVLACLCVLAVIAQGLSTGAWLWLSLMRADWVMAGVDLVLLATAGLACLSAMRLTAPKQGAALKNAEPIIC